MEANNTKAMNARTEAINALVKPQESQAQGPQGWQQQAQSTRLHHYPQPWEKCLCVHRQRCQALPTKVPGQGSNPAPGCSCSSGSSSQRCPGPFQSSTIETSVCQCEDGMTAVPPGLLSAGSWRLPGLFMQINLRQYLSKK